MWQKFLATSLSVMIIFGTMFMVEFKDSTNQLQRRYVKHLRFVDGGVFLYNDINLFQKAPIYLDADDFPEGSFVYVPTLRLGGIIPIGTKEVR